MELWMRRKLVRSWPEVKLVCVFSAGIEVGGVICLMPGWSQVSDDFEDGNDDGWTRLNPLGDFGGKATFSFPGGESYRFQVGTSPNAETLGQARGGSLRADIDHTAFRVSVESLAVFTDLGDGVGEIEADKNDGTQFMRVTAGGD